MKVFADVFEKGSCNSDCNCFSCDSSCHCECDGSGDPCNWGG